MRMTTPLLGAAIGGGIGMLKRDPAKYALWGAGIGLLVTIMGGAAISVGGVSIRVGAESGEIGEVQAMLRQIGYDVDMDGFLGSKTTLAIKSAQGRCGLRPDGQLTRETIACITRLANMPSGPVVSGLQSGPAIVGYDVRFKYTVEQGTPVWLHMPQGDQRPDIFLDMTWGIYEGNVYERSGSLQRVNIDGTIAWVPASAIRVNANFRGS